MGTEGEVSLRAVVFSDMVGSTDLLVRAGDLAADRTRLAHEEITRSVVRRHHGEIVKSLGDGIMAVFPSVWTACSAAAALHQESDLWSREPDREGYQLRIGVSAGDVIASGGDYYGIAVVEARRLQEGAPPGRTWIAAPSLRLVRNSASLRTTDVGPRHLKGIPDPVAVVELDWDARPDVPVVSDVQLPPPLGRRADLPFAGRSYLLGELRRAWSATLEAEAPVVLLAGEPGIGKTRAAAEFARQVVSDGGRVLAGSCDEHLPNPFRPFGEALSWHVERLSHPETALGRHAGDLRRLLPDLDQRVPGLPKASITDEATARLRLLEACESWLVGEDASGALTGVRTLLVLDDLQWADPGTVLLLRHLAESVRPGLMVLGTFRDTDVHDDHPLYPVLADLRRLPNATRLDVAGLDQHEVRELLRRAGGRILEGEGKDIAAALESRTSGNPFFLGELLRHLEESGLLHQEHGRWRTAGDLGQAVPAGVRDVVVRRVQMLPEGSFAALRIGAVVGQQFDLDLVTRVADSPSWDVLDVLVAACEAGLVEEMGPDRFRFSHAIVRDVLYEDVPSSRRVRVHRAVAGALEVRHAGDLDSAAIELARHWSVPGVSDDAGQVVARAIAAAEHSSGRGAHEGAVQWYQRALDLAADHPELGDARRRTLVALADAERKSGDPAHRETAMRAARESMAAGDAALTRRALLVYGRFGYSVVQRADPEKVALLREALATQQFAPMHRIEVLGMLATELLFVGGIAERRRLLDEIEGLLPELDPQARGAIMANSSIWKFSALDVATCAARTADVRTAVTAHASGEDPRPGYEWADEAVYFLTYLSCFVGDRDAMDRDLDLLCSITEGSEDPVRAMWTDVTEVMLSMIDGRVADAEAGVQRFIATMQQAQAPEAEGWAGLGFVATARERGQLPLLLGAFGTDAERSARGGPVVAAFGYINLVAGNDAIAREVIDAITVDDIADDGALAFTMPMLCEVAARVGSEDLCRGLLDRYRTWTGAHLACGPGYSGAADRLFALLADRLGDHDEADRWFARALAQHEAMRSPPWVARTFLDWAESLLARGDARGAATHLEPTSAAIGSLELGESRKRLDDLQRRIGMRA